MKKQLTTLLSQPKAHGFPLPGRRQPGGGLIVNYPHLARLLNTTSQMRYIEAYRRIVEVSGIPAGDDAYLYQPITGTQRPSAQSRTGSARPVSSVLDIAAGVFYRVKCT
ncbi:hypothetical protein ACIBI9_18410 [Nonomuraea sp. NPDC050451]|uniref:hypothetical protein n=1 Tax=Nonomuraea sp. NPDC050451 TaxID=3364364 RepID=UPI0037AF0C3E